MMIAKDKEVLGAATFVACYKAVGLPTLGLEQRQDVLVSELGRVSVVLAVETWRCGTTLASRAAPMTAKSVQTVPSASFRSSR